VLVEQLNELCKIRQGSREPVHFVDHDDVDLTGPDLHQNVPQGRAVERGAREGAVIVVVGDKPPALVSLALDGGLTGFTLGIERVELEVEVMLGRFPGVDRTAQELFDRLIDAFRDARETLFDLNKRRANSVVTRRPSHYVDNAHGLPAAPPGSAREAAKLRAASE
jgi:hypothetical protein